MQHSTATTTLESNDLAIVHKKRTRRPPTPRYPSHKCKHLAARPTLRQPSFIRIAFTGKICSGKTTTAKYVQDVAKKRNFALVERVAFGDFVKEMAKSYFGYDGSKYTNRELLVKLGASMRVIEPNVWINCLKNKILKSDAKHWVVDDVRHKNEVDALRGMGFTVIHINIDEATRIERVKSTYPGTYEEYMNAHTHSTETELFDDTDKNLVSVVDRVVQWREVEGVMEELLQLN